MNSSGKNILVISYYFPPAGGPGVQRVLKFVKYLPEFGVNPIVLTVRNGDFPAEDKSMQKEIPDSVPVYRTPAIEPYNIYRKFTGKSENHTLPVGLLAKNENTSVSEYIAKWIRANIFLPDARIGWIWPVFNLGSKIIAKYNIQAIYSSSPPHSLQLTAKMLAQRFNLPWIADFRDPWTDIYYYQLAPRTTLARNIDLYLERKVLYTADKVVSVSPSITRKLAQKIQKDNFGVLYNGYDEDDFIDLQPTVTMPKKFTLSYIGNLKSNQNPIELWTTLQRLIKQYDDFKSVVELRFTGRIHPRILETLEHHQLISYTSVEGYVPHSAAISRMQSTAVLLFIIPEAPDNEGILTGKLFDYLRAGRPLLSLGPPHGDAARVLQDVDAGPMLYPQDGKAIQQRILHLFQMWQANKLENASPASNMIQQFERRELTKILANNVNELIQTK